MKNIAMFDFVTSIQFNRVKYNPLLHPNPWLPPTPIPSGPPRVLPTLPRVSQSPSSVLPLGLCTSSPRDLKVSAPDHCQAACWEPFSSVCPAQRRWIEGRLGTSLQDPCQAGFCTKYYTLCQVQRSLEVTVCQRRNLYLICMSPVAVGGPGQQGLSAELGNRPPWWMVTFKLP